MLALGGCADADDPDASSRTRGQTLAIYASLPRHGVSRQAAEAVAAGQRMALADAGRRAGRFRVRLVELAATEAGDRVWDPGRVSANARRAAGDPAAIAYLGELDYGASAVSLPVTNAAGILQLSPADGLTSLTRTPPGRARAGPGRYYPSDRRTFLRLVPSDLRLAEAMLELARGWGARRATIVRDAGIYGEELAAQLVALGRRKGPVPAAVEEVPGPKGARETVRALAERRPDAVLYAGVTGPATEPLVAELGRRLPAVPVVASGGLLALAPAARFAVAPRSLRALSPMRPASAYPRSGRRLLRRLRRRAGRELARPEALYGYESVRLVLEAIEAAGGSRSAVVRRALAVRTRRGVIGSYRVTATGDVADGRFAQYRLEAERFVFERLVR